MFLKLFTRKEREWIGFFSITSFLLRLPLAFRPEPSLAGLPYGDDAYYMFSIARNMAKGLGPSCDGIHITNGFQPLITFLYVPMFWLAKNDSWLAIRYSLILNGIIAALSIWTLAYAMRSLEREPRSRMSVPTIAAALWTFSILIFYHTTNGLETGLYSLLLLASIGLYATLYSSKSRSLRSIIVLGIILGFTVLTRIDAAILVAILFIWELFKKQFQYAFLLAGIAFLVSLPWWYFNFHIFGSLMPTSGLAEQSWPHSSMESVSRTLQAMLDSVLLLWYVPDKLPFGYRVAVAVLVLGCIIWASQKLHAPSFLRTHSKQRALYPFGLFSIVLLVYYSVIFGAPHFMARFVQPLRMLWLIVIAFTVPLIFSFIERSERPIKILFLMAGTSMIAFGADRYFVSCYMPGKTIGFYLMGQYALRHPQEKFGMLQSGIAGFIAPNVVNLDGKVNADALDAHLKGHLGTYIGNEHCTYIADVDGMIQDLAALSKKDELYFDSVGMVGQIHLMKRRTENISPVSN